MNNTKGNSYSSEDTDIRDIIDVESIDLYSDKEEVLRKWLKNYGLLSLEGNYKRNKECLTQVFNLLDIIAVIKVEEFIKSNNTQKIFEDNKTYIELLYKNKTRKIAISSSFHNRIYALECYGCKLPKDLNTVLRIVRNNTTHGSETVVKEYIDLSYDRTVGYMELMADAFIELGFMEPRYKKPDFNDLRVHISSTLQDGKYIIKNKIGEGGTSRVYLAEQKNLNRKLAIKELKPYAYTSELLQNEIDVMLSIRHAQIPHVYDAFYENGTYYIVMDYIDGTTLNKYCKESELSEKQKLSLSKNILDIISYLHSSYVDLVIVDLKPENIMVGRDNKPYLIDFGIAQGKDGKVIQGFSDEYSAPEITNGFGGSKLSDIYSVGKVIEYIYSDGGTADYINSEVRDVIDKCITNNPDKRYSTAEDVNNALDDCYNTNKKNKKAAEKSVKKSIDKPAKKTVKKSVKKSEEKPQKKLPAAPMETSADTSMGILPAASEDTSMYIPSAAPVDTSIYIPPAAPAVTPIDISSAVPELTPLDIPPAAPIVTTTNLSSENLYDNSGYNNYYKDNIKKKGKKVWIVSFLVVFLVFNLWLFIKIFGSRRDELSESDTITTQNAAVQTTEDNYTDNDIASAARDIYYLMKYYCQNNEKNSFDSLFIGEKELIDNRYNYINDTILTSGYNDIIAYKICKNGKYYYVGYFNYKDTKTLPDENPVCITFADIMTNEDGEWKIVLKSDSLDEIKEKILGLLYPDALNAIESGRNYYSPSIEKGDFSWSANDVVIPDRVCSDVFLVWQNEDGSVDIYLNVKNGTDEELNISGINITMTNTSGGIEETVIQHSFGGASVPANESKNLHGHIEPDEVLTGTEQWDDIQCSYNFE
ncbi:MAG: serine/threonine protein kinase [Lachnospiraceae bacterium]|nr:serine/threonine protein kinase [Lachnospiraceae bacterium]